MAGSLCEHYVSVQAEATAHEDVNINAIFKAKPDRSVSMCSAAVAVLFYAGDLIKTALDEKAARAERPSQSRERVFAVNVITARSSNCTPGFDGIW